MLQKAPVVGVSSNERPALVSPSPGATGGDGMGVCWFRKGTSRTRDVIARSRKDARDIGLRSAESKGSIKKTRMTVPPDAPSRPG
jgi:hypothetical protein